MLGFRNVFLMFIAIPYVALECKECDQTLLVSLVMTVTLVVQRWRVFLGQA